MTPYMGTIGNSTSPGQSVTGRQSRGHLIRGLMQELDRLSTVDSTTTAANNAVMNNLTDLLLRDAVRERATDIHLDPLRDGVHVRLRIDGKLLDTEVLGHEQGTRLIRHFKVISNLDTTHAFRIADSRITHSVEGRLIDLRLAAAPTVAGEKLSIRLLDPERVTQRLDQLGLSEAQYEQIRQCMVNTRGLFLVAGPTGSGKTTTVYSLLHELKQLDCGIVTVEDPVEYEIEGISQIQVDSRHGLTFGDALRGVQRLDADYILLGEIRDSEAAGAAIETAGSGRVVMSTIHSPDAVGTITSLRNLGVSDSEIATSVRIIVAQRLVRRLCPLCRRLETPSEIERHWLKASVAEVPAQIWNAPGCTSCRGLGHIGRIGLFGVWVLGDDDYALIIDHAPERILRQHLTSKGYHSVARDALMKAQQGITSFAEVRASGLSHFNQTSTSPEAPALSPEPAAPGPRAAAYLA
jgi:type II secretory ATPase GspE/PulE/Tfp pilus assembly ATPase PilB-like protein